MQINKSINFASYCDIIKICTYNEDEGIVAEMSPQEALVLAALLQQAATRILLEK